MIWCHVSWCLQARRRKRDEIAKELQDSNLRLQLYARGAEWASKDEATHSVLQRHLLRGLGLQVLDLLLRHQEVCAPHSTCHPIPLATADSRSL